MQLLECFWPNVTPPSERGTQRSEENKGIQLDLELILVPRAAERSLWPGGEATFPSADPLEYCNQTGTTTLLKEKNDQQQLPLEFNSLIVPHS